MAEVISTPQVGNITEYTIISTSSDTTFETNLKGFTINPGTTFGEVKTADENLITSLSTDIYSDTKLTSQILVSEKLEPVTFSPAEITFNVQASSNAYSSAMVWLSAPAGTTGGYFVMQNGDQIAESYKVCLTFSQIYSNKIQFEVRLYYRAGKGTTKNCKLIMFVNGNGYEIPVTITIS